MKKNNPEWISYTIIIISTIVLFAIIYYAYKFIWPAIVIIILLPILSMLNYYKKLSTDKENIHATSGIIWLIACFFAIGFLVKNDEIKTNANNYFLDGEISTIIFNEGGELEEFPEEEREIFIPATKKGERSMKIINTSISILGLLSIGLTTFIAVKQLTRYLEMQERQKKSKSGYY